MLAIAGGKGGVGKTTTALGVGVALAARRRDPVVVDADADAPNLHLVAGTDGDGLDDLVAGSEIAAASTPAPRYDGVRILGARPGAPVARALRALVTERPVVVDTPAGASPDAVLPLRLADHALVVTTPDPEAVQDAAKTARVARSVGTTVVGWVVSRSSTVPDHVADTAGGVPLVPVPTCRDPPVEARDAYDGALTAWVNA